MIRFCLIAVLFSLASALAAQTIPLVLTELDGAEPGFAATLSLEARGVVQGRAPCNTYSAPMTEKLPAFRVTAIRSTRMACPDLAAEQRFFDLLQQMEHAEQAEGVLTLTGAGHVMVFSSAP